MGESGRTWRLGISLLVLALIVAYFFLFPETLPAELGIRAQWRISSEATGQFSAVNEGIPFSFQDRFGYFSPDGRASAIGLSAGGTQISGERYIQGDTATNSALFDAEGKLIGRIEGYGPFFVGNRLFSATPDGLGLRAHDAFASAQWLYMFPSHLSAFNASPTLAIGGTVDGTIEGVGLDGSRVFSFAPGGSRLQVILGLAISPNAKHIAAISGVDPQRLVVLGQGAGDYRVISHRYLDSDYREPVRVAFMPGDRYVLYRRPDGIGIWSIDGKVDELLPITAEDFDVYYDEGRDLAYVAARTRDSLSIIAFQPPTRILGRIELPVHSEFVHVDSSALYFGGMDGLYKLVFLEE
ncbi:MAG TPA: hypothetical protein DCG47_07945 [Spirochaetaceae bacterium]|nr:hypothetical protein [Spirochaetaceae bacterium]